APSRVSQEGLERWGIPLGGEQITGPLPAEHVVRRITPGRALISLVARQEVEEQRGMVEAPAHPRATFRGAFAPPALEDLAEQPLARTAAQEHVLARRVVIAVARRDCDPFDTERHCLVEERRYLIRVFPAEERAGDGRT